jgi:hypothetical protein
MEVSAKTGDGLEEWYTGSQHIRGNCSPVIISTTLVDPMTVFIFTPWFPGGNFPDYCCIYCPEDGLL